MSRSKLLGAIFALPLMIAGAGSAQANIIGLTIDGSGSISGSDWNLQKQGYVNALTTLLNTDGSNSIGVWMFDDVVTQVFAVQKIDSVAKKTALITAISNMVQPGDFTAIGDSINTAAAALNAFNTVANCGSVGGCGNRIIDVSTDGANNSGASPVTAANAAFATGIKVNCLGIGGSADCTWNNATNGQDWNATSFAEFEAAIISKLSAELTPTPEPITMSLFGAGLAGAAFMRRRKMKTA